MEYRRGSTSGVQQGTGFNAAGIQSGGPYRQRKRVLTMALMSVPAAEPTSDNTLLRRHRERFSWWDECFNRRKNKIDFASGTSADSNILKIYGMLDRTNGDKHYYQVLHPGLTVNVV